MSVVIKVARLQETLLQVAHDCGISSDPLMRSENAERMSATSSVPPGWLSLVVQGDLDAWFSILVGQALTITCEVPDFPSWIADSGSHSRPSLDPLLQEARKLGIDISVRIEVRKEPLEGELLGLLPGAATDLRIVLFFFGERLTAMLGDARTYYSFFESRILKPPVPLRDQRLLILLADTVGRLQGPYLALLGNNHLDEAVNFAATPESFESVAKVREIARESSWDTRPQLLTPDFFALDSTLASGLDSVRAELARLQNELSVPYLANRTEGTPGDLHSFFEGPRTVEIIGGASGSSESLYPLYRWTYEEPAAASTKLEIVRRVVASRFAAKSIPCNTLVKEAEELLSEAKVQLRVLVDENVVKSFERRERVDKIVRDYADSIAKQTQALTREVVDNVYKTAALLFGVVITYLLKPNQGPLVLTLSVVFYVVYLLVVIFFYLGAIRKEQRSRQRDYLRSVRFFKKSEILTGEADARLRSVRGEELKFNKTLWRVSFFYRTLMATALLALGIWLLLRDSKPTPDERRASALEEQARRFKEVEYEEILPKIPGQSISALLTDPTGTITRFPDLTAVKKDGTLIVLAWVPCERIDNAKELERLTLLHKLAAQRQADLQFLTESVCGAEPGPDRLRAWLDDKKIPAPRIWSF